MNGWYYLLIVVGGILAVLLFANWQTKGLFFRLWMIKVLGGGRILIRIRTRLNHYYKIGFLVEPQIKFKKRGQKGWVFLTIPGKEKDGEVGTPILGNGGDIFYRTLGVVGVDVDEAKNAFYSPNADAISGFDSPTIEKIIIRCLMDPGGQPNWILLLVGIGITLLAVIIVGTLVNSNHGLILTTQNETMKMIVQYCGTRVVG